MKYELPLTELMRAGFRVSSRVAGYLAVGLLLNLGLLWKFFPDLKAFDGFSTTTLLRLAGMLVIVASPVLYYLLGVRQGSRAAVFGLVKKYKAPLVHTLLAKMMARFPELFACVAGAAGAEGAARLWGQVKEKFDQILGANSLFLRMALRTFVSRVRFLSLAEDALGKFAGKEGDPEKRLEKMAEWIAERVPDDRFAPSWTPLAFTLTLNVGLVTALAVL